MRPTKETRLIEWRLSDVGCLSACGRFQLVPCLRWGGYLVLDARGESGHAYQLRAAQKVAEVRLGNEKGEGVAA